MQKNKAMLIKYNSDSDKIFIIELRDLILSKVEYLKGFFEIQICPFDIVGLYNYKEFRISCLYEINKFANSFLVKIDIKAFIPVFCDLCGNPFEYQFSTSVQEVFTTFFEYKNTLEDMYYFIFDGKEIDIGKVCVENFISNLPSRFHDGCS